MKKLKVIATDGGSVEIMYEASVKLDSVSFRKKWLGFSYIVYLSNGDEQNLKC